MKNVFLTEGNWQGSIPHDHPDMRNDSAWMHLLQATHRCLYEYEQVKDYDNVFVMFPKGVLNLNMIGLEVANNINPVSTLLSQDIGSTLKQNNKKVHYIQEGPTWLFNDYSVIDQFNFYNLLSSMDTIFAHNDFDIKFYKGLFPSKHIATIPPVMIHHHLSTITPQPEDKVMIGGNFARWYGGFQSYIVADAFGVEKWIPSSHAQREYENQIEDINHLPRMRWLDWMKTLSTFKYAVHLMPTAAAGTFSLNCAYFGIPCIGNKNIDTQNLCHPKLSVDVDDVEKARALATQLREDEEFYTQCSVECKEKYKEHYDADEWKSNIKRKLLI
tara:strand:+ start:53 stop:1039 length:987 start_codon:yes stop_codon:yes gene_type:complete